jgi:hypothetical protein
MSKFLTAQWNKATDEMQGFFEEMDAKIAKGKKEQAEIEEHARAFADHVKSRLAYIRAEIEAERVSYAEIAELQELAPFIDPGDTLLLQWANVPEEAEKVDLIASGYEWICPKCDTENREIEVTEFVTCKECLCKFETGDHHHAIG